MTWLRKSEQAALYDARVGMMICNACCTYRSITIVKKNHCRRACCTIEKRCCLSKWRVGLGNEVDKGSSHCAKVDYEYFVALMECPLLSYRTF